MTLDSKTLGAFILSFTILVNVGLSYFGIADKITCELASISPQTQAAAAALFNK